LLSLLLQLQKELAFHNIKLYPAASDGDYDEIEVARNAAISVRLKSALSRLILFSFSLGRK